MQRMLKSEPPKGRHTVVVVSDIELGTGGVTDDLPQSDAVPDCLWRYNERPHRDRDVTVVFNGDTFDFLKARVNGRHPRHVTVSVALAKLSQMATAHARFFSGMKAWLTHGCARRRLVFVVGNHDPELMFPEVQAELRRLLGNSERVLFPGMSWQLGNVRFEHGQQDDRFHRLNVRKPFLRYNDEPILNLSWGAVALMDVALPWHHLLCHFDRMQPAGRAMDFYPELSTIFTQAYAQYYVREFAPQWLSGRDPMRRVTREMVAEVVGRFRAPGIEVRCSDPTERLMRHEGAALHVMAHLHKPSQRDERGVRVMRTGCFRNEYTVGDGGEGFALMPCVYAEIMLDHDRVTDAQLIEVQASPPPPGYLPESVAALAEHVSIARDMAIERWGSWSDLVGDFKVLRKLPGLSSLRL